MAGVWNIFMLSAQHISHAVNGKTLFKKLNISLQSGDRVALVGRNGTGKSTLLSILCQAIHPDEGSITLSGGDRVSMVTQSINQNMPLQKLAQDRLGKSWNENIELPKLLAKLDLSKITPAQKVTILSGGQQLRLQIAIALCNAPTILLIDEPTNHLDIAGRMWLIEFLQTFRGGYLVVSHDRDFLDKTANMIYELDDEVLHQYVGGYSDYIIQKEEQRVNILNKYRIQENYKKRITKDIKATKAGALERELETKLDTSRRLAAKAAKKAKAREHRLQQQMESEDWIQKPNTPHSIILNIEKQPQKRHRVIHLSDIVVGFGSNILINKTTASVYSNDFIALLGENGSGKSALIKTIIGEVVPLSGSILREAQIGYLSQQTDLDTSQTVLKTLLQSGINQTSARGFIDRLGFSQDQINQTISSLSAGETVKLRLASMLLGDYDFIILDEPTNNLDFASIDVVEQLLRESPIGFLIVTHDQQLIKNLNLTSQWIIDKKLLKINTS